MTRRWTMWFVALLLLSLIALVPLRVAIGGLADRGFTARQVAGTIWYGRIGELSLRGSRLGTFEVALDPGPVLIGAIELGFDRMDDPQGPLGGTFVGGSKSGIRTSSGRLSIAGLIGKIPADVVTLDAVTILFKGGQCIEASGTIGIAIAAPLPGLGAVQYRGTPTCDRDRVRFLLSGPAGGGTVELQIRSTGDLRAVLRIPNADVAVGAAAALSAAGFSETAQGWTLSAQGKL